VSKPNLARITEKLTRSQANFLSVADAIPSDLWRSRPPQGGWSAGEVVGHLCQVERTILVNADRIIRHPPKPIPLFRRFRMPLKLVEVRVLRRQTPIPLDPGLLAEKETMLASLRGIRERTCAFLEETSARDLSAYYWPHPFLGTLNVYRWLELIACHQIRHAKQMQHISHGLPKRVATSQN
jgi:DinB family protein